MRLQIAKNTVIAAAVAGTASTAALLVAILHVQHPSDLTAPVIALVAPVWIGFVATVATGSAVTGLPLGFVCSFAAYFFPARVLVTAVLRNEQGRQELWGQVAASAVIYALGILATLIPWPL